MKTFLLTLSLLFATLKLSAQEYINSTVNQTGTWSSYYEDWVWSDWNKVNINFLLQRNVIISDDVAKSTYTTLKIIYDKDGTVTWDAIDEKGLSCFVTMGIINGYNCLMIVYSDLCFRYYYE